MHHIFLFLYRFFCWIVSILPLSAARKETASLKLLSWYLMLYEGISKPGFLAQKKRVKTHDTPLPLPHHFIDGDYDYTLLFLLNGKRDAVSTASEALAALLEEHRVRVLIAELDVLPGTLQLSRHHSGFPEEIKLAFPGKFATFITTLKYLHVDRIHVHQLALMPFYFLKSIGEIADHLNIPYDITLHDYTYICPRLSLRDANGNSLQEATLEEYEEVVKRDGGYIPRHISVGVWRDTTHRFLQHAHSIYAPNNDIIAAYKQVFPDIELHLRPHEKLREKYSNPLTQYYGITL